MWSKLKTDPCALLKHRVYRYSQDNLRELPHNGTKKHFSYLCTDIKHFVMTNYGVKCEIVLCVACPRGRYGVQCRRFCTCAEGGMCDPVNGSCRCGLGWTGQHCEKGCDGAFWTCLCRTLWVWWEALWSGHWTVSLSTRKDRKTLWESLCSRSYGLSNVSVHTEASVTGAQVTALVLSPGWDPPVKKVFL